ncbi:hypothetical protein THASP1DRAFT_30672 [Thamnocephalis sphaerospora]|uniref:PHD-type domain-containing protein n=1 Tax=Thamnocephalis sphaerospora TaxID=78915 RepID=A0A4P9XNI9_9FUNG|nr:hypothetical protein THASP1DRAFT_30672 [Thamnocephalis sphaerospora]|eukprot:RKP07516.1 hypothetical protein THASP1DRAFT_30672 [Thamnocephalis sphaerospora]
MVTQSNVMPAATAPSSAATSKPTTFAVSESDVSTPKVSQPANVPSTAAPTIPKIRLKIGKLSIGLPAVAPAPLPLPAMHDDDAADEEVIRCICPDATLDNGKFMIACDRCSVWFHGDCVGVGPDMEDGAEWFCMRCTGRR